MLQVWRACLLQGTHSCGGDSSGNLPSQEARGRRSACLQAQ